MSGPLILAKDNHLKTIWEHTLDNSPPVSDSSFFWTDGRQDIVKRRCAFALSFYSLIRNIARRTFHIAGPRDCFCVKFFPPRQLVNFSSRNSWFEHLFFLNDIFVRFAFTLSTSQVQVIKKLMLVLQDRPSSSISSSHFYVIHVYETELTLFSMHTQAFPIRYFFPIPVPTTLFSNGLSHKRPASGWPYKFRSRATTGSSMFDHDVGHLCRGRRIDISGNSDLGSFSNAGKPSFLTWILSGHCISCFFRAFQADTAWRALQQPPEPHSWATMENRNDRWLLYLHPKRLGF